MTPRSLAYATDLAVLTLQGAGIERGEGVTAVSMPGNPGFRWGNFLLVDEAGDPALRIAEHAARFPAAAHAVIGVDDPRPRIDGAAWRDAGFSVAVHAVLTAERLPAPPSEVAVRPLRTPRDWREAAAVSGEDARPEDLEFARLRHLDRRRAAASGRAVWLGAEVDGRIVATLGVVDAGDGTARYQDVMTLTAHRRRGLASALVAAAGGLAAHRFGSRRLVIVAEPEGGAISLYRRLGFRQVEQQLQLEQDLVGGAA